MAESCFLSKGRIQPWNTYWKMRQHVPQPGSMDIIQEAVVLDSSLPQISVTRNRSSIWESAQQTKGDVTLLLDIESNFFSFFLSVSDLFL